MKPFTPRRRRSAGADYAPPTRSIAPPLVALDRVLDRATLRVSPSCLTCSLRIDSDDRIALLGQNGNG
jgi:hypothetical protein